MGNAHGTFMRAGIILLLVLAPRGVQAQQFYTDDAAIVDAGACQVEGWYGETALWLLPACHFVPNLELTVGLGVLQDAGQRLEYVVQGKYLLRDVSPRGVGVAVAAGLGFGPLAQVPGDGVAAAFAYVPVTWAPGAGRLVFHGNIGWQFDRNETGIRHALIWGVAGDALLPLPGERFTFIGELFGEGDDRPEYQVGLRVSLVTDRLHTDVSWGGHTARDRDGDGLVVGFTWTPPPLR
jgi:hypothetical protein